MESSKERVKHFVKISGNIDGDFVEEIYFFPVQRQKFIFQYMLDDRPHVIQHCKNILGDVNRREQYYFYDHMVKSMARFVDLTKFFDDSGAQ